MRQGAACRHEGEPPIPHRRGRRVAARQVAEIPRTRSGNISEVAVRDTIHGRPVANDSALATPECLALYKDLAELAM